MSGLSGPARQALGAAFAALASAGGFAITWLPQTVYIEKYKDVVHYYRYGRKLELTDELQKRAHQVLEDIKLSDNLKNFVTFFHSATPDPFHAGALESSYGCLVGIPVTFTYKTVDDVQTQEIALVKGSIDWESPAGKLLKQSFVLSENAQKFAMAQQFNLTNNGEVTVRTITATGAILNIYVFSKMFTRRLPGLPYYARYILYGLASTICGLGYLYIRDMTTYSYERDALDKAVHLGPEYCQGALEYYQKTLVRNKALRVLMGSKGASNYTVRGNVNTIFRTPHMPLSSCLDRVKYWNFKLYNSSKDEPKTEQEQTSNE